MQLFDTHCHYNLAPLTAAWQTHWQNAQQASVSKSLIVGTTLNTSELALEQAAHEQNLYVSLGIHPGHGQEIVNFDQEVQELSQLSSNPKVVAIGEVGLDYYHLPVNNDNVTNKEKQRQLFIAMINLANQANLPMILHVRDKGETAYLQTLALLEKHWNFKKALVFHCVSGPLSYIEQALRLKNSYFGFDGNLTFKNATYQREIFALVKQTDPQKILLETDAPYLAPEPYRGQTCTPAMIAQTAHFAATKLGLDLNLVYQNSLRAFGFS